MLSILGNMLLQAAFQLMLFIVTQRQPWYVRATPKPDRKDVQAMENTALFLLSNFMYLIFALIVSRVKHFRQPIHRNCKCFPFFLLCLTDFAHFWVALLQIISQALRCFSLSHPSVWHYVPWLVSRELYKWCICLSLFESPFVSSRWLLVHSASYQNHSSFPSSWPVGVGIKDFIRFIYFIFLSLSSSSVERYSPVNWSTSSIAILQDWLSLRIVSRKCTTRTASSRKSFKGSKDRCRNRMCL